MTAKPSPQGVAATDLSNRALISILAGALCASIFATIITASLTGIWGLPGGPLLQAAAAIGALCLVGSFLAVLAKRRGRPGKTGFRSHVWLASIGTGLVLAHGAGGLLKPPATLFVLLLLLIGLGVWSRLQGARMMAQTFGEKRAGFAKPTPAVRAELAALIEQKQTLLAKLDPSANEALFSPQIRHWFSAPILALRYTKLATEESRIVGAAAGLPKIQARWRVVHRLAALAFVGGLLAHIIIVMLFAGYAADGGDIYWLHFAAWNF